MRCSRRRVTFEEILAKLPKPYYRDSAVAIYHADCRDILPLIPNGSIQLLLTSPPFNAGMEYEKESWPTLQAYYDFLRDCFGIAIPKLRSGGWCIFEMADMHVSPEHPHALNGQREQFNMTTSAVLISYLVNQLYYKGETIWYRGRWTSNFAKRLVCAPGSPAILVQHSKVQFFRKTGGREGAYQYPQLDVSLKVKWCRSVWENIQPEYDPQHPAVMPELMVSGIIQCWSVPSNELILDPFLGSGTTCYCAKKLGRKSIGIEIEEKYCQIAAERCQQSVMKL